MELSLNGKVPQGLQKTDYQSQEIGNEFPSKFITTFAFFGPKY